MYDKIHHKLKKKKSDEDILRKEIYRPIAFMNKNKKFFKQKYYQSKSNKLKFHTYKKKIFLKEHS